MLPAQLVLGFLKTVYKGLTLPTWTPWTSYFDPNSQAFSTHKVSHPMATDRLQGVSQWNPARLCLILALSLWSLTMVPSGNANRLQRRTTNDFHFFNYMRLTFNLSEEFLQNKPATDIDGNPIPDYDVVYTFDQLIDHTDPDLGTFQQRYYLTWEHYRPGGPIVLLNPGEQSIEGLAAIVTNRSMAGTIAQATNGAVIVLEQRFYGLSNPYPSLTVSNLKYHTIEQAVDDLVYFAQNVELAMPGGNTAAIRPNQTAWILIGGSYSGALTAWTMGHRPGTFWAGYSSSGVVQPLLDFWQYWEPARNHMPANCSADVQRVVGYIDDAIASENSTLISQIQTSFGVQGVELFPFLNLLSQPVGEWQMLDIATDEQSGFYQFCDLLETPRGASLERPAEGVGLERAFENWSSWMREDWLPRICQGFDTRLCITFSLLGYRDTQIDNSQRSWLWTVCSETGWLQTGAPEGNPTIVSRFLSVSALEGHCMETFPGAFESGTFGSRVDATTAKYKGWNLTVDHLFVVNGRRDPWLGVSHSAPAVNITSTELQPIYLTDGFHCSDMSRINSRFDESIANVYREASTTFQSWVSDFNTLVSTGEVPGFAGPRDGEIGGRSGSTSFSATLAFSSAIVVVAGSLLFI
ncbi:hypothetical protein FA15DRAFT_672436 [Coprinopsis marcescibilis]|uniref:Peptidase S28 n=1 Tax=Coprinopsis marcescibilis TaxID=230819 RepID=A0A5C3KMY4_COPMA|nr:hypothetical protein FA15DRAFT_672436 [Coprinopsis marcescibilis]